MHIQFVFNRLIVAGAYSSIAIYNSWRRLRSIAVCAADSMASQRNHIHDSVAAETETKVRSLERALAKRDITVPMGQPRRLAISR
jgi:hypothetical protein